MFYSILRIIVRVLLYIVNGKPHYLNRENLPEGNYILVGPHRTWFDPVCYALAASPKKFSFMAKQELFKNPIVRFILKHVRMSDGSPRHDSLRLAAAFRDLFEGL